jgi:hypothetical protein
VPLRIEFHALLLLEWREGVDQSSERLRNRSVRSYQATAFALCILENHKVIMLQYIRNLSSKVGETPLAFVHRATVPSFEAQLACKQPLLMGQPRDVAPLANLKGFIPPLCTGVV